MYMFWKEAAWKPSRKRSDLICDVGMSEYMCPCYVDLSWHTCIAYAGTTLPFASCCCWVYRSIRLINVNYSTSMYWNVTFLSVSVFLFTNADLIQNTQRKYEIHSMLWRIRTVATVVQVKHRQFLDVIWIPFPSFSVKREHCNFLI